jgi:hypothetical protein
MALMLAELYDALKDAGASDELARKAAEAVAGYDDRLARMERRLEVLTYMVGTNITISLILLGLAWQIMRALPK